MSDSIARKDYKGNILITGSSRGIGQAILEKFVSEGYFVYGTYNTGKKEADRLEKKYVGQVKFYKVNFSQKSQIRSFIKKMQKFDFYCIVNNAGTFEIEKFDNYDINIWYRVVQVNLNSIVELSIGLKDNITSPGSIVNISSTDGSTGSFASMSYAASKAGINSITKSLANNLGIRGIRVNAIAPGWINTAMATEASYEASVLTPLNRNGKPEEVAELAYFLSSEKASYINGSIVVADGGYTNVDYIMKKEAGLLS
jgi:NAD(P)-dependent dehydrogenase (short-subunit alcohol dehydrogenase family)